MPTASQTNGETCGETRPIARGEIRGETERAGPQIELARGKASA